MVVEAVVAAAKKNNSKPMEMECRALWKKCFGDSDLYMDYYFGEKCRKSKLLTDIEDNHVVSMLYLNPYELMWKGKKIKSYYIVGVATEEKYRKQGRMRKLLEQAFVLMKEEQVPFTYLMPVNTKIYEPFAFQTVYRQNRLRITGITEKQRKAVQRKDWSVSLLMKQITELTKEEMEVLELYCNQKLKEEFDLYVVRDIDYYQQLQREMESMNGKTFVFFTEQGMVCGVVAYGLENGYVEMVECLIEKVYTKDILELVLEQEGIEDKSQIFFYESYFIDETMLRELGSEFEYIGKDTTMVKLLTENKDYQSLYDNPKVYINELV